MGITYRLMSLVIVALVLGLPAGGQAAGFGAPEVLPSPGAAVDSPVAAIAPNGRTALVWRTTGRRTEEYRYVAAIGPSPGHLGRPVVVPAAVRAARGATGLALLAGSDGTLFACFRDGPRRGQTVLGCSVALAGSQFGRLRELRRYDARQKPQLAVAARRDGKLVAVVSRLDAAGGREIRGGVVDRTGRLTATQALGVSDSSVEINMATGPDGTVAVAWSTSTESLESRTPTLRLMRPGSNVFGPPENAIPDAAIVRGPSLIGGAGLVLTYDVQDPQGPAVTRVVGRSIDGTYTAPQALPRPGAGFLKGALTIEPDGAPLVISNAFIEANSDCGPTTSGIVGAGPPLNPTDTRAPVRLSAPGQIALRPRAAGLSDGTTIAAWGNAAGPGGRERLEVAIRRPGATAFASPQVLPRLVAQDRILAAGGNQALLAWVVGEQPDGPSRIVVSALRRDPPYAPPAPRPTRSRTGCSG